MTSIRISKVHYEMLASLGKKLRYKPEQMLEELIQEKFNCSKK